MKISLEKQVAFLQKLISFDDHGWDKVAANSISALSVFQDAQLDREGVFVYRIPPDYKGEFWIARCEDGTVLGALGTETYLVEPFDSSNEEVNLLLTKLHYRLFNKRPYAEQLVDRFLSMGE